MTDLPKARLLPGVPFEAKARKKRSRSSTPAAASSCTPPFEDVRPFLSGEPLHGLTPPAPAAAKARPAAPPPQAEHEPPAQSDAEQDENVAA